MARTGGRIAGGNFAPKPLGQPQPNALSSLIGLVDTPWGFIIDFESGFVEATYYLDAIPFTDLLTTNVSFGFNLSSCMGWVALTGKILGIPNDGAFWSFPLDIPGCRDKPNKLRCNDNTETTTRCIDWVEYYVNNDPEVEPIDLSDISVLTFYNNSINDRQVHYFPDGDGEELIVQKTQQARHFYGLNVHFEFDIEFEQWVAAINKEIKIELCSIAYACWHGTGYRHSVGEGGAGRIFGDCGIFSGAYGGTVETAEFWIVNRHPQIGQYFDGTNFYSDYAGYGSNPDVSPWTYSAHGFTTPIADEIANGGLYHVSEDPPDFVEYIAEALYIKPNNPGRPPRRFAIQEFYHYFFNDGTPFEGQRDGPLIPWGPAEPISFPPPSKVMARKGCSCDEIYKMLRVIYRLLGHDVFPVHLPSSLFSYTDGREPLVTNNYIETLMWFIKQFDGLVGQFPIEIEIEDIDPTTQGKQTKKIELPNISEALAETYGLAVESTVNSDIAISFLMRLAAEAIATKNAALITQDYAKANAEYLGYKGNPKDREVNYAFNPKQLDNLEQILSEQTFKIVGWENKDENSVAVYLAKLMFSAGIIKETFYRNSKTDKLADILNRLTKKGDESSDADWQEFLNYINFSDSFLNKEQKYPQPKLRDRTNPADENGPNT